MTTSRLFSYHLMNYKHNVVKKMFLFGKILHLVVDSSVLLKKKSTVPQGPQICTRSVKYINFLCQNQNKNFIYLIKLHNTFSSYLTLTLPVNQSVEEGVEIVRKCVLAADTAADASGTPSGLWNRCSLGNHFPLYGVIINHT